jgi:hypothetical protein
MPFRSAAEGVDRSDGDTARLKASPKTSFLCFSVAEPHAVGVPGRKSGPQGSRLGAPDGVAFRGDMILAVLYRHRGRDLLTSE